MDEAVSALFARSDPSAPRTLGILFSALRGVGPYRIEPKKTSLHLNGPKSAFAGVHPRKTGFVLNLRTGTPIESDRIRKVERVSANRFHNELFITDPKEIDEDLLSWLRDAYQLSQ